MSEELKPCPFCGGSADYCETTVWWLRCDDCGADAPSGETKESADRLWNFRPDIAAKDSDLTTLRASLAEREEEVRRLGEVLEALRKPGAKMSNICFNLSQSSTQSAADRVSMKSCQEEWDAAAKAIPAALSPTSDLTRVQGGVEKGWQPIETCPIRDTVDLWCVYGGEEYAQFEGGASIGMLVSGRFRTEEYGFFGNQSNDGVPRKNAPDLVPVAWRDAVPQCPAELIAKALGIPLTLEAALAASSKEVSHD